MHSQWTGREKIRPPAMASGTAQPTAKARGLMEGLHCSTLRPSPANKSAGLAVLLSSTLNAFPDGSVPGSNTDPSTTSGGNYGTKPFRCYGSSTNGRKAVPPSAGHSRTAWGLRSFTWIFQSHTDCRRGLPRLDRSLFWAKRALLFI